MITCTLCEYNNIEGVDVCEQCGQPLNESHLRSPQNAVEQGLLSDQVDVALSPKTPVVVTAQTPVQDVLKIMHDRHIGCVFVVEDGVAVGVFSERDALMRLNTQVDQLRAEPVSQFMTSKPEKLTGDTRIAFAVQKMDVGGYRHLPIVDNDGKAVGVISARDILRYLSQKMAEGSAG